MGDFKISECASSFGMNNTLWNSFPIKMCQFVNQNMVLEQNGSPWTHSHWISFVSNRTSRSCTDDFFEEWNEFIPQTHIRKFEGKTTWGWVLRWGSFLTYIGSSMDPVDVRNDSQQGTRSQAVCYSNFLIWGVISFHSSKKSPVLGCDEKARLLDWMKNLINSNMIRS